MEIERSLVFIWEDEEWIKKILIAGGLMLTGFGAIGVAGWLAELSRRVANDEDTPLPEWDDIGRYFVIGLKYLGIIFLWALPVILLIVAISLISVFAFTQEDPTALAAVITVFSICIYVLFFIYVLLITLLVMPLWVQLAEDTAFGELVNPTPSWKLLRANLGGYLVVMLVTWMATMAASLVGTLLCVVGVFFTGIITQAFFAHMVGQATAQARENLEHQPAVPVVD
jgi:hypothetical protein